MVDAIDSVVAFAAFEVGFSGAITVDEFVGSVDVCLVQLSTPPIQFARDVPLVINSNPGSANSEWLI